MKEAIELCPDELWVGGTHPRNFWRIAYHALFYTDLYLAQNEQAFEPWEKHRPECRVLWGDPPAEDPYSREDVLAYLEGLNETVKSRIASLDLDASETGYDWYPKSMNKLDHVVMNVRHLQEHIGQLRDRLINAGFEPDWIGKR